MKNDTNWQNVGLGIIAITILGLISWALFHEIGQAPWQFIAILIAFLGGIITLAGNFQLQIRNEQKPKKVEVYDKLIKKLFFDSLFASKLGQQPKTEEEIVQIFAEMTPDLILWASDDVLNVYTKIRQIKINKAEETSSNSIFLFSELLLAIRKDLGHQNKQISKVSILSVFVNDVENLSK